MNYCSDFTCSYPVNGRFTPMQRDIYEIVLAANAHAFEMAKPGLLYKEVHRLRGKSSSKDSSRSVSSGATWTMRWPTGYMRSSCPTASDTSWGSTSTIWRISGKSTWDTTSRRNAARSSA